MEKFLVILCFAVFSAATATDFQPKFLTREGKFVCVKGSA
jgi:hypothetical protein